MGIDRGARERVAALASVEEQGRCRGCIQVWSLGAEENCSQPVCHLLMLAMLLFTYMLEADEAMDAPR